jgi:hypothetical protein
MPKKRKEEEQVSEQDIIDDLEELMLEFDELLKKENKMATKKSTVSKISDKLVKVNESFTINMYDNGYMFEIGGRNHNDDWATAKILVPTIEDLVTLVQEASDMERDN